MKASTWELIDRTGFAVSFLCAVHCIALPFLLPFLPLIAGSFFWSEGFEEGVVYAALLLATPALIRGYLRHRRVWVPAAFALGVGFLLLRPGHHVHGDHIHLEPEHFVFAACAGLSLAVGHFLNLRFCRSCHACLEHGEAKTCPSHQE